VAPSGSQVACLSPLDLSPATTGGVVQVLTPPEPPTPLVSLGEEDPLSLAPTYFPWDSSGLLSDVEPFETVAVGLPPRVVDASLLKGMKQVQVVAGFVSSGGLGWQCCGCLIKCWWLLACCWSADGAHERATAHVLVVRSM
jgi:hypothetical protein